MEKTPKEYRKELRAWYKELKASKHCAVCGRDKKKQFHHINPDEKVMTVSQMVHLAYPKDIIIEEMEKCIVLCCRCHLKTHREMKKKKTT